MKQILSLLGVISVVLFAVSGVAAQNIASGERVQVVGSFNGYATTPYGTDYRTTTYRRLSITSGTPTDGRGQWATTINVQNSGGDVLPVNMNGGGGNGFLFISGPSNNRFQNKWVFSGVGQGTVNGVNNISAFNSGNDMGLNMSTPGRYTFVFNDAGYTATNARYYVGRTTSDPVTVSRTAQSFSGNTLTINITTGSTPSTDENVYVRYTSGADFSGSTGTSVVQASGGATAWSASIPSVPCGTTFRYYVFTSTRTLAQINAHTEAERSLVALRYDDNSGNNYTYILNNPTAFNVTGGGNYCSGGSGVTVDLAGSQAGISYQLRRDGNNTGSPVISTGSAISFGSQTLSGNYDVTASNGSCGANMSGSVTVTELSNITYYQDNDGDTYGNPNVTQTSCTGAPSGYVSDNTDCDDGNASVNPGATEICNDIDDDCDGSTDEGVTTTFYADNDGDGFGDANNSIEACSAPGGYVSDNTDCDDSQVLYTDADGDGYGTNTPAACGVYDNTDCDDSDFTVNPGASDDVCNNLDKNCDGMVDLAPHVLLYEDADGDGYGNDNNFNYFSVCALPSGYVENGGDCNDNDGGTNPGATEVCDGADNDCNGSVDDGITCDPDNDGDGYPQSVDCDDNNSSVNPGATEICNGIDDNCDGNVDEGALTTFYADNDGDGFGDANNSTEACVAPGGYVSDNTDCNDSDATNAAPARPGSALYSPGQRNLCNESSITLTVTNDPNANFYSWTLPAGFTGSSNTNSIVVSPTGNFGRATFSVTATNGCGTSLPRNISIWGTPSTPVVSGPTCATNPQLGLVYTVTNAEPGVTYTWQLPNKVTSQTGLTGTSITVNWARSTPAGIRVVGNNACGNSPSGRINVSICAPQIAGTGKSGVLVYPNPTNGNANLLLTLAKETKVAIVVYDMAGKQLQRKELVGMTGQNRIGLDMAAFPNGIYLVSIITAGEVQTVKLVKGL